MFPSIEWTSLQKKVINYLLIYVRENIIKLFVIIYANIGVTSAKMLIIYNAIGINYAKKVLLYWHLVKFVKNRNKILKIIFHPKNRSFI